MAQPIAIRPSASERAAQAAARVAARYAQAPSYSDLQAAEARNALRAAQIATQAALQAQASAQAVLAGLEAAQQEQQSMLPAVETAARPSTPPAPVVAPVEAPVAQAIEPERLQIRWEPDMPVLPAAPPAARSHYQTQQRTSAPQDRWAEPVASAEPWGVEELEPVEPMQPLHANLIEFPRELVAARKVRPRLAEAAAAEAAERQLSIFEVDPSSISTEPEAAAVAAPPAEPVWQAAEYAAPRWSGMELDAQSVMELPDDPLTPQPVMELASFSRRFMAVVVDSALVTASFLGSAWWYCRNLQAMPELRVLEVNAAVALLGIGLLYHILFFTLGEATPGMKYAHLSLCTFEDERPSRTQLHFRLGALLLSLIPAGLGIAWALFDEDHLSWHDRLSHTYLRKC
jgi:uncharacterized RDD family membrane protein YckC